MVTVEQKKNCHLMLDKMEENKDEVIVGEEGLQQGGLWVMQSRGNHHDKGGEGMTREESIQTRDTHTHTLCAPESVCVCACVCACVCVWIM